MVVSPRFTVLRAFLCTAICLVFLGPACLCAQDTVDISDVTIIARKSGFSALGKKNVRIDSATQEQFRYQAIADLLSLNTAVYMKTYGPGGIVTSALRGGNAEQTAILWNGMNLQNTMLGQTDLGTILSILFESVGVEYGGSSAMWGSGAVGGSIHLDNASVIGKKFRVSTSIGSGTTGQLNSSAVIVAGRDKMVNTTKVYASRSSNHFRYRQPQGESVATMTNAAFQGRGVMNEFKAAIGKRQIVSLNVWLNGSDRMLPGIDPIQIVKRYQDDQALRILGSWSYTKNDFRSQVRSAYFNERINYDDSLQLLYTKNRAQTFMFDNENFWRWGRGHELYAGLSQLFTMASSGNYEGQKMLRRFSLLAGNKFMLAKNKLLFGINGRAEYFSAGTLPVTGNLAIEYKPFKFMTAGVNASKIYRQPTLNELYWMPGGNEKLLPEEGEALDAVLTIKKMVRTTALSLSGAVYSRRINNWILWLPGAGSNPTPLNLQEVWSRGIEWTGKVSRVKKDVSAGLRVVTSYVLSTVEKSEVPNTASVGRQLVYTPRYTANGHLYFGYRATQVHVFIHYAGYRFITSDNSQWLDPYSMVSLRMTQGFEGAGIRFTAYAACNNLLNTDYVVLAGRPMPLRYFEFGLAMHFKSNKPQTP